MTDDKISIHIDAAKKRADIPETTDGPCGRAGCPWPEFECGFGLAGGGYGPYEYCPVCSRIVSKVDLPPNME